MTLDELVTVFEAARIGTRPYVNGKHNGDVAGIRAVVEALREVICDGYAENSARDLANQFNEILASGEVKAAGGPAREDGLTDTTPVIPTPAADVCPYCEGEKCTPTRQVCDLGESKP